PAKYVSISPFITALAGGSALALAIPTRDIEARANAPTRACLGEDMIDPPGDMRPGLQRCALPARGPGHTAFREEEAGDPGPEAAEGVQDAADRALLRRPIRTDVGEDLAHHVLLMLERVLRHRPRRDPERVEVFPEEDRGRDEHPDAAEFERGER